MERGEVREKIEEDLNYDSSEDEVARSLLDGTEYTVGQLRELEENPMDYLWMADPSHGDVEYDGEYFEVEVDSNSLKTLFSTHSWPRTAPERRFRIKTQTWYRENFDPDDYSREDLEAISEGEFEEIDGVKPENGLMKDLTRISAPSVMGSPLVASAEPAASFIGVPFTALQFYRVDQERKKRKGYRRKASEELKRMEKQSRANFLARKYSGAKVRTVSGETDESLDYDFDIDWQKIKESADQNNVRSAEFLGNDVTGAFTETVETIEDSEEYRIEDVYAEIIPGSEDGYQILVEGSQQIGTDNFPLDQPILRFEPEEINELTELAEEQEIVSKT